MALTGFELLPRTLDKGLEATRAHVVGNLLVPRLRLILFKPGSQLSQILWIKTRDGSFDLLNTHAVSVAASLERSQASAPAGPLDLR